MKLVDVCIRRPVATTMFIAFLVVLGWFSYRQLSVDLYPNVDFPITAITTTLSGASVEEMESSVTKPLEEAINTIEGIDELTSTTSEGLSTVIVFFSLSRFRMAEGANHQTSQMGGRMKVIFGMLKSLLFK